MRVQWDDGKSPESSFDADFLRTHAKLVAAPLTETSGPTSPVPVDVEWLRPYCFFRGGEAPPPGALRLWAGPATTFGRGSSSSPTWRTRRRIWRC